MTAVAGGREEKINSTSKMSSGSKRVWNKLELAGKLEFGLDSVHSLGYEHHLDSFNLVGKTDVKIENGRIYY